MHESNKCKTKYPILLLHGTGFRDRKILNYWGRIPKELKRNGAKIFYGEQDSWGTVENNAKLIKENIKKIISQEKLQKLNIIAHSKGGLEARYLISSLNMVDNIASLTTIATPHHGSKTMDVFCCLPKKIFTISAYFIDLWFKILGDKKPDFQKACKEFCTTHAIEFNKNNPNVDKVYYQSYTGVMKNFFSDITMFVPHLIVYFLEGENDGLITPNSAKWGVFQGVLRGANSRGISHADEVDMRRRRLTKMKRNGFVSDIVDEYIKIVISLKQLGF